MMDPQDARKIAKMDSIKEKVRAYIQKNFIGRERHLSDDQALLDDGVIDSLGHLKLISYLEKEFSVSFSIDDLDWQNFNSIEKIELLIKRKISPG